MDKFPVDYSSLEERVNRKKAFRLSEVEDKIEKVAFDIVRFKDVNDEAIAGLWQVQSAEDGDLIVAMYEEPKDKPLEVNSSWKAISDRSGKNVSVFYKNTPVIKVALASLGIPEDDADLVCRYLPNSLASDKNLVYSLVSELPESQFKNLAAEHPELTDGVQISKKAQEQAWYEVVYKLKDEQEERSSLIPHPSHAMAAQEMNQVQMEHGLNLEYAHVRERGY